ncbi:MAG: hypothetical protein BWZ10_00439 [candidate division BRC1 bacterium ADurb.BinA364]|nr:MAG: hypothetical protein BWZ10_00439 [candidate division BRC1 bacterium ADurb.BinA364]
MARLGADRDFAVHSAWNRHGVDGNRRRDGGAADNRRHDRRRRSRNGPIVDQIPLGHRSDSADFFGRRRTGSGCFSAKMERSVGGGGGQFRRAVSDLRRHGVLGAALERQGKLAGWSRAVDHFGGRCVCGDAGTRIEWNKLWQDAAGGLFCHRFRHGVGAGSDLFSIHLSNADFRAGSGRSFFCASWNDFAFFQAFRRAPIGI